MRVSRGFLALLVLLTGISCALGPDYKRPEVPVPQTYREAAPGGEAVANVPWWEIFQDDALKELVRTALRENKDLKIAAARIAEARAALGYTRADQWPSVTYLGQALREKTFDGESHQIDNTYLVAADASFEIDLWGRLRRSTESSREKLLATEEAFRTVTITLVADVATNYLLLRDLDARLQISEDTHKSRLDSLEIIRARYKEGIVSELDVSQAEIQEANAAASISSFQRQVDQAEHALSILLGRNPGPIPRGASLEAQVFPPEVPAGLPSELLERRPDVLDAEHLLHAQTAQIGVAQAMRFPSFSLTGEYGSESDELSRNVSTGASVWNLTLNVVGPIFQAGKNKRRVEVEKARTEQALQAYEKTLQQAFKEVEDALVAVRTLKDEHEAVARSVTAARKARLLSQARYDAGISSYLEVLDSERSLFLAQLQASETLQKRLAAVVALYKALGGGWQPEPSARSEAASTTETQRHRGKWDLFPKDERGNDRAAPAGAFLF